MTTGLKNHLEILSQNRQSLSNLLNEVCQSNPFLEYTPSQDLQTYLENGISNKPSLKDELYLQLHTLNTKYNETIANYIIESLDVNGFFDYQITDVLSDLKCNEKEFKNTLTCIQNLEPIGVAAKDSLDSIQIQLLHKNHKLAYSILKNYPSFLETKDYASIASSLNIEYDKVIQELSHIQQCTPFPCSEYENESQNSYILPEFSLIVEESDIKIVPKEMGNITLKNNDIKVTKELRKYLNEAKFYIDSLNRRNKTLLLLANILIQHQKNYFLFQDDLKECTLKQIANESGYSISTVSRTLNGKYYEFNHQIYPIKDLFVSKTYGGSSKDSIQKTIQLLVDNEDKSKPLLDEQIVEELSNMELYASRRTVSKYRKELHIPNSKQRKKGD